jgi:hypothetical protein
MSVLEYQCCFCGEKIENTELQPIEVLLSGPDGSSQTVWLHVDCLESRLHKSIPWLSLEDREECVE